MVVQEDQAGELGPCDYILNTTAARALKRLMNPEPYYRYPRIESYYRTRDTGLTDTLTDTLTDEGVHD